MDFVKRSVLVSLILFVKESDSIYDSLEPEINFFDFGNQTVLDFNISKNTKIADIKFQINENNHLYTKDIVENFNNFCLESISCEIKLEVKLINGWKPYKIAINNENRHYPWFHSCGNINLWPVTIETCTINFYLSNFNKIGDIIEAESLLATDDDTGPSGLIEIWAKSNSISLRKIFSPEGHIKNIFLVLNKAPTELRNTKIVIKSEDKGTPSRITKAFIQFILKESLKFEKTNYYISLNEENLFKDTALINIHVNMSYTDEKYIIYRLLNHQDIFLIDVYGDIFLQDYVDTTSLFENSKLIIEARVQDDIDNVATAYLWINSTLTKSMITWNNMSHCDTRKRALYFSSNSSIKYKIAEIRAAGLNIFAQNVGYSMKLKTNGPFKLELQEEKEKYLRNVLKGTIYLTEKLNLKNKDYNLTIKFCISFARFYRCTSSWFKAIVYDENLCKPKFNRKLIDLALNSSSNALITKLNAIECSGNGTYYNKTTKEFENFNYRKLYYRLLNRNHYNYIDIDSDEGIISFKNSVNQMEPFHLEIEIIAFQEWKPLNYIESDSLTVRLNWKTSQLSSTLLLLAVIITVITSLILFVFIKFKLRICIK